MTRYIDYSVSPKEYPPPLTFDSGLPTKSGNRGNKSKWVYPEDILVVTPDRNERRSDYTGAFRPEAEKFCEVHDVDTDNILKIDIRQGRHRMTAQLIEALDVKPGYKIVAMFCHGYAHGIQFGFRSPNYRRATKKDKESFRCLAEVLAWQPHVSVALYACSTGDDPDGDDDTAPGSGDESFADLLRDELCRNGARTCRVFAHVTAGHATKNPHIKFYDGNYSADGGSGAGYLCRPGTSSFRTLVTALRKDDFRFRVPFLTVDRVHQLLSRR